MGWLEAASGLIGSAIVLIVLRAWLNSQREDIKDDISGVRQKIEKISSHQHKCETERLPNIEQRTAKLEARLNGLTTT